MQYAQRNASYQPVVPVVTCKTERWKLELHGTIDRWPAAIDVLVSWRRARYVPNVEPVASNNSDSRELRLFPVPELGVEAVKRLTDREHAYDGVLPAISNVRLERDPRSGRDRLHLSVVETTYSAVRALSDSALIDSKSRDRGPSARVNLDIFFREQNLPAPPTAATISLLPITQDGYVVFTRRPTTGFGYEGAYAPAVNGNLDIPDPRRKVDDADSYGLPDFVGAIAREAREELNLSLAAKDIYLRGIGRIWTDPDFATWVLAFTAFVPQTLEEVAAEAAFADVIEGSWEVDDLFAIPVPQTAEDATRIMR